MDSLRRTLLTCVDCKQPVCSIEPPTFTSGQTFTLKKVLNAIGGSAESVLSALVDPAALGDAFSVRCIRCHRGE